MKGPEKSLRALCEAISDCQCGESSPPMFPDDLDAWEDDHFHQVCPQVERSRWDDTPVPAITRRPA